MECTHYSRLCTRLHHVKLKNAKSPYHGRGLSPLPHPPPSSVTSLPRISHSKTLIQCWQPCAYMYVYSRPTVRETLTLRLGIFLVKTTGCQQSPDKQGTEHRLDNVVHYSTHNRLYSHFTLSPSSWNQGSKCIHQNTYMYTNMYTCTYTYTLQYAQHSAVYM